MAGRGHPVPSWMSQANAPGGLSNGSAKGNAKDWAEHTAADGRKYFHNKITKVTTWEKPNELKSADELAASSGPWKEYTSDTGRKYFYNTVTHQSSWEVPTDIKGSVGDGLDSPKYGITDVYLPNSPSTDKKDPTSAFRDLLSAAGVKPTWSWEMTQGQISTDPRYKALKSMSERKQAFGEWCQQRKKQDEEDRRRKDRQIKEDYFMMLKDNREISPKTLWRKAQSMIETDPRYSAVDERDRELLYEEFLYEMERREREDEKQSRKDSMLRFKKLLEATPNITVKTQWRKLKDQMGDDPAFKALDKLDSLTVFEDHMMDLDHKDEEEARMEREKQRRESRKARDSFRELLAERLDSGELTLKTKWRDFVKAVKERDDPRYMNMFNSTGYGENSDNTSSTPHELFCDFLEDLEERIDKDKRILRDILKDVNFSVGLTTPFEEFEAALIPHERFITIPKQHLKHLFHELVDKAQSKEHSNLKRKKKLISGFKEMLKNFNEITLSSTWVDARPLVFSQREFEALDDEQEREKAFTEYITRLGEKQKAREEGRKEEDSEKSEGEDEEKKKHRKKEHKSKSKKHRHRDEDKDRKKKRHSHSSSDEDLPSKKVKKEQEDAMMEEGEEGETRETRGREEGENGDDRKGDIKMEDDGEIKRDDRYMKREEEDRFERRRRDDRNDDRGRRRDDMEEGERRDYERDRGIKKELVEEKEEGETE